MRCCFRSKHWNIFMILHWRAMIFKKLSSLFKFFSWLTLFFSATHEIGVRLALTIYNALKKDFSCYTVSLNVTKIKGWYEEGETLQLLLIWTFIQKIEQSVIRHAIVWCNSHQAARDAWQIKAQTAVVQGFGAPRYEKVAWRRLGYLEMAERIMPYADAQWCIQKWRGCQSRRDSWSKAAILKNCSSFTDQMLHAYWITKCLADKCQTDQTTVEMPSKQNA